VSVHYLPGVQFCAQYCEPNTTIIGPGGRLPTEHTVGECAECVQVTRWLCHDVLPSIRRSGYYVPAGTPVEAELRAMVEQRGASNQILELLREFLGGGE
jgi:hypothetical protein